MNGEVNGIILVEPGVHLEQGHYREKLSLWVEGFRLAGWNVFVACLEAPELGFLPDAVFKPVEPMWKYIGHVLPNQIRVPWLVLCTFWLGFRYGKKMGYPVFGLTTSSLSPVAAARLSAGAFRVPFAQILMYGNMFDRTVPKFKKALAYLSLNFLLRSGSAIFPNTDRTRQSLVLKTKNRKFYDRIVTLYDPIYVPKAPIPSAKKRTQGILLVPGLDDTRRSPLFHLEQSKLVEPPKTLWIHAPGRKKEHVLATTGERLKFIPCIQVSTDYRYAEALVELFASASWCLIAYEPRFFQGSGLLAQSLVAGTPVLCSRFPHAEELFARFGRLGELFSFGDMNDFCEAWSRLRNWTSEQWDEFHEAKRLFADAVNSERTTRKVIEYFAPSNAKTA